MMDDAIRNAIEIRRKVLTDYYLIAEPAAAKIEHLFAQIVTLGDSCTDVAEFESKFVASALNQQYLALFPELKVKPAVVAEALKTSGKELLADPAARRQFLTDQAEAVANTLTQPLRHEAATAAYEQLQDTPLGTAVDAAHDVEQAKRIFTIFKRKK